MFKKYGMAIAIVACTAVIAMAVVSPYLGRIHKGGKEKVMCKGSGTSKIELIVDRGLGTEQIVHAEDYEINIGSYTFVRYSIRTETVPAE